jgi:hypothetical protein
MADGIGIPHGGRDHREGFLALTRAMLNAGANDVAGTLMEETISPMAGSEHGSVKSVGNSWPSVRVVGALWSNGPPRTPPGPDDEHSAGAVLWTCRRYQRV